MPAHPEVVFVHFAHTHSSPSHNMSGSNTLPSKEAKSEGRAHTATVGKHRSGCDIQVLGMIHPSSQGQFLDCCTPEPFFASRRKHVFKNASAWCLLRCEDSKIHNEKGTPNPFSVVCSVMHYCKQGKVPIHLCSHLTVLCLPAW